MTSGQSHSFWQDLPKPFFALAPMANVTDFAFRTMIAKYGKPDVTWTEFVSADGLISSGQKKLLIDLKFGEKERPIVAQLFTGHPEAMRKASEIIRKKKFDGLDINMGCPDRAVEKQGGGASLMKNPKLALEVLMSAREGAKNIPVSVKTRIGYNKVDVDWIRFLLEQNLPALTVHLRTRKEMSDVPAHWELMPEIVRLRNEISPGTLIIGNGDVVSLEDGANKVKQYGCDGIMIGRGIFGKPWLLGRKLGAGSKENEEKRMENGEKKSDNSPYSLLLTSRLKILIEHTKLFEKSFCGKKHHKSFDVMKKHFKAYVSGWPASAGRVGAKELRVKLMGANSVKEVKKIVGDYLDLHAV